MKTNTKYSIVLNNGDKVEGLNKGKLVLTVIKDVVTSKKVKKVEVLESLISNQIRRSVKGEGTGYSDKVWDLFEGADKWNSKRRFFIEEDNVIQVGDAQVVVNREWGWPCKQNRNCWMAFVSVATELGYKITVAGASQEEADAFKKLGKKSK